MAIERQTPEQAKAAAQEMVSMFATLRSQATTTREKLDIVRSENRFGPSVVNIIKGRFK